MLHPSYTDLMKVVNQDVEEGESKVVNSRYSIVMATSKRTQDSGRKRRRGIGIEREDKGQMPYGICLSDC